MAPEFTDTEHGLVRVERAGDSVEVSTRNWPECSQEASMTRAQFTRFVKLCQQVLAEWSSEEE